MNNALVVAWTSVVGDALFCAPRKSDSVGDGQGGGHRDTRDLPEKSINAPSLPLRTTAINGVPITELLTRLRAGDQLALSALYLAFHPALWRLGVILIGSAEVAEEMVQDVFLAVWRRRDTFTPEDDIRAYLYTALRNAAKMRGRHTRVVHAVESAVAQHRLELPAYGQTPSSPDRNAEVNEFYVAYRRALVALSDRERIAVQLRLEDEATFEEIGQVIGLSKVGARTVVLRAEGKIRALLAEYRT